MGAHRSKPIIMLIINERIQKTAKVMDKINDEVSIRNRQDMEDTRLSSELRRMNREGDSVRRSGDIKKIDTFNKKYVKNFSRLSIIRQNTGTTNRDEVAKEIKKWKEQN
jgi:hypothetical protein